MTWTEIEGVESVEIDGVETAGPVRIFVQASVPTAAEHLRATNPEFAFAATVLDLARRGVHVSTAVPRRETFPPATDPPRRRRRKRNRKSYEQRRR